jgi:hypothetical protein
MGYRPAALARGQSMVILMGVVLKFKRPTGICAGRSGPPWRFNPGGKKAAEPEELGGWSPAAGAALGSISAAPSEFGDWKSLGAVVAAVMGAGGQDSSASAPRPATYAIMPCYRG